METVKVTLSGIDRSLDDGLAPDGSCMELINARIKNGSVEPVGEPIQIAGFPATVDKLFFHSLAQRIIARYTDGSLHSYLWDYTHEEPLSDDLTGTQRVEFVGNMAVFFLPDGMRYALFNGTSYQYLGSLPELPQVSITMEAKAEYDDSGTIYSSKDYTKCTEEEFRETSIYNLVGHHDKCIANLNKEGYFFGDLFICYAYRLFDGSHTRISPIRHLISNIECSVKLNIGGDDVINYLHKGNEISSSMVFSTRVIAYAFGSKPVIKVSPSGLEAWRNVIMGIDFYVAAIRKFQKKEVRLNEENAAYKDYRYYKYKRSINSDKEADEAFRNLAVFRRFAEYDLDGNEVFRLEEPSEDNLQVQEALDFSQVESAITASDLSYVYNSRLHLVGIRQKYVGPDKTLCNFNAIDTLLPVDIAVEIESEYGNVVAHTATTSPATLSDSFLSYPDTGAVRMGIYYQGYSKSAPVQMKKHPTLPIAYHLAGASESLRAVTAPSGATYVTCYLIAEWPYEVIGGYNTHYLPAENNPFHERPNVLKVSSVSNPMTFPAAQTYRPCTGEIVGMCSNTTALSQGQYGQHPLYVFAKDGVFAMTTDTTGRLAYATHTPVSRDVCTSPGSIRGTDRSVLFATQRGLMEIAGTQVRCLSEAMDGFLPSCLDSSPIFAKVAGVAGLQGALSTTEFRTYIEGANVGYEYAANEVIVANPSYDYAYVLSLDSMAWRKASIRILSFTNHYPELYALIPHTAGEEKTRLLCRIHNPHRTVAKMLLLTRPIKLGSQTHKRVLQTALRGIVRRAMSDLYFRGEPILFRGEELNLFSDVGLYILGSNDAEHFELISGKEAITDLRDLVTKMNKSRAYKYFAVALAGGVRTDVSLNYIEFLADTAFTNRLR